MGAFLNIDFRSPLTDPRLEKVKMVLKVEGCLNSIMVRRQQKRIVRQSGKRVRSVERNISSVNGIKDRSEDAALKGLHPEWNE